jgi:superoxide dismutase, Fe-Mn family
MAHTLPALTYTSASLEPHIDSRTMDIHHGKHHAAYVTNLNAALEAHPDLQAKSLEDLIANIGSLPEAIRGAVRNNGGGHWNHSMFWKWMSPDGGKCNGKVASEIDKSFGSFDAFKEAFSKAAMTRFGSGWAWLIKTPNGLAITSTPNQDNPLMDVADVKGTPILGLDVWEHAYYLNYQNRRADYVGAFFNVINWDYVNELLG